MAELRRVPGPRSPFDGWRGPAVGIVVIGIALAVAKPWGDAPPAARPDPTATLAPTPAPISRVPVGRILDPAAFGVEAPPAEWAILTAEKTIRLDFLDRADADPPVEPESDDEGSGPIVSGPVVELGTTDDVDAIVIAHPADRSITVIRAWQFVDGGAPRRLELGRLASPWAVDHVEVVGRRRSEMGADRVLPWPPGLYRIDLLVEPFGRVRSIMADVAPGEDGMVATDDLEPRVDDTVFDRSMLRLLPDTANLWAAAGYLSGWRRPTSGPGCRIVEIWQATDPADACWPLPLGRTDAIGVNLTDGRAVASIDLRAVDPLPGPTRVVAELDVDDRPGRALVRDPRGTLDDGIYRLDVATTDGEGLTWYVEVGPIGRAVATFYEASTSR